MLAVSASPSECQSSEPTTEPSVGSAAVAGALLGQPELGIRRITYVGLPEREAVHLALETRRRGLRPTLTRGAAGSASVVVRAPDQLAEAASRSAPGSWMRLCEAGRQLGHSLSRLPPRRRPGSAVPAPAPLAAIGES